MPLCLSTRALVYGKNGAMRCPLPTKKKDRMSLALTQENMIELLEVFDRHSENELKDISWVNNLGLSDLFFVKDRATYCPHVQKLVLEPGSTVAVHVIFMVIFTL